MARLEKVRISGDSRSAFVVESFGFLEGGSAELAIKNVKIDGLAENEDPSAALVLFKFPTAEAGEGATNLAREEGKCFLETATEERMEPVMLVTGLITDRTFSFDADSAGMWVLVLSRCVPSVGTVSFDVDLDFHNPGPNYLSAGDTPLPAVYIGMAVAFFGLLFAWSIIAVRNRANVHTIHFLMTALVLAKALSLLFQGVSLEAVSRTGHASAWNVLFYAFAFMRGVLLFVVILLVGAGWSLLKPALSRREKSLLCCVLAMQVLDNIALVVVDDVSPGSVAHVNWSALLHFLDILCCCAVLFPTVSTIRALNEKASGDSRTSFALLKLRQFRQFYLIAVTYLYTTRIVMFLVDVNLSYRHTWMGPAGTELATLAFYAFAGYKFRPMTDNPYLRVSAGDEGADSDGGEEVEMTGSHEYGMRHDDAADEGDVEASPGRPEDGSAAPDVETRVAHVTADTETTGLTTLPEVDSADEEASVSA